MAWELAGLLLIASIAVAVVALRRRTVRKGRLDALRRAVSNPHWAAARGTCAGFTLMYGQLHQVVARTARGPSFDSR